MGEKKLRYQKVKIKNKKLLRYQYFYEEIDNIKNKMIIRELEK